MKTISHYMFLMVMMMTVTQAVRGQTFNLGLAAEDSTMVKFVNSIISEKGTISIAADSITQDFSRMSKIPDETDETEEGGLRIPPLTPLLHPHIPNSFPINTGKTVGEIPIQHYVTAYGTTTYTVPIECAPGRADMQPPITLNYSSHGGDGLLGTGWRIGGLPFINRVASNYYYDGTVQPIEMDATAKFVMDGQQLIQTATNSTVRTFAPEQGNVKIEAYMSGVVTKYFKVWFSNGSMAIYGYENNSVNKLQYPVTLMTDVLGNTIKFTYEEVNNHYYIKEIKYGSSKTITNDFASIKFFYKTRSDISSEWEAGIEITENRLLDYIQCINNSTVIRTYNFTYTLNKVSLLTQIDCNLTSGSLNPLRFYYGTDNPLTQISNFPAQLNNFPYSTTGWVTSKCKIDKWGDDVLIVYRKLDPYYEQGSTYQNLYPSGESLRIYSGLANGTVNPDVLTSGAGFVELTSGDIDGKSGDELIKINNTVSGTSDYLTFAVYKPGTTGYTVYKTVSYSPMPAIGASNSLTPKEFLVGDFAGTGRMQVLAVSRYNPLGNGNASKIMVFDLETGATLCNIVAPFNFTASNTSGDIIFAMDYDGDGRAEIALMHGKNIEIYTFSGTNSLTLTKIASISTGIPNINRMLMVGDINGDGKTDMLFSPPLDFLDNNWIAYYSKCKGDAGGTNGFDVKFIPLFQHVNNSNGTPSSYILQDVNNDGKADLVRLYDGAITVYPATGAGISATPEPATATATNGAIMIPAVVSQGNYHTQMLALNNGSMNKYAFKRNDTRERMMSAAVSSLGIVTKSEYRRLEEKDPSIYAPGSTETFPYENLNAYLWVTWKTLTAYNDETKNHIVYSYTKAINHRQGLGFLGFEVFTATDLRSRIVKQTFEPKNYSVLKKIETPTSIIENNFYILTNANKTAIVRPTQQKVTDLLKNNVNTTNYLSYDSYNQPTGIETEYGTGSGVKTKQEYIYNNYDSGTGSGRVFVLGLPAEEKITHTRAGSSWIDKTAITYYASRLPDVKTTFTGTSGTSQTAYEKFTYDTEGNLLTHTFKPYSSANSQIATYTYDTHKRLLKTVTDPMGRVTTYDVYDGYGRLTKLKDFMNQTTTFEYDEQDRQTKIIAPTGIGVTTQNTFAWNSSNNGSVMSVTTTATKQPAAVRYTDAFGRTTRESEMGFNGAYIHTDYLYDKYGMLLKKSDPYTGTPRYTEYEYYDDDRLKKLTAPSNGVTNFTYSGNTVTTAVVNGMTTSKTYDASGALIQASDPAGNIVYTLRPDGQPSSIKTPDNTITSFGYDAYGRQQSITDPSAGTIQYQYTAEGLLFKQINARNQTVQYAYNSFGQPTAITSPEQTVSYTYDPTYKRLTKITAGSHYEISYAYDALGRVNKETEKEGTVTLVKDYTFDAGRVATVKYNNAANDVLTYTCNSYGYLSSMKFGAATIYTVNERNHFGQLKKYTFGNGVETNRTYSDYGLPMTMTTAKNGVTGLPNLTFQFDDVTGMPAWRKDARSANVQENFTYDNLRRLKNYGSSAVNYTTNYSDMGNIIFKTDAGTLEYQNTARPYQITGQTGFPATVDTALRVVTYTSGERPATITKSGTTATFAYNHAHQRTKMAVTGAVNYTRTYLGGNYEHEAVTGGATTERLYLGGTPYNAPAVAIRTNGGAWALHYIHRDHLGSIVAITNAATTTAPAESNSYDAWGRLRNASTLQPFAHNAQPALLLRRGYTSHEHLPEFGLINMNARLYDPVIGRMLSPDPYVQMPDFSQSYNRYAYCLNNPLIYTDPDGENFRDWWRRLFGNAAKPHLANDGGGEPLSGHDYDIFIPEVTISGNASKPPPSPPDYSIMNNWDYWDNSRFNGSYYGGSVDDGGGASQVISALNNASAYNNVATAIVTPSVNAGIKVSNQVIQNTRNATVIAREAQALKVLQPIAGVAKGAGAAGVVVSTGISTYLVLSGNATTMDKVDLGVGGSALLGAGGAFLLGSNPVGWAILGGAGIYFTGRMVYDWIY